jgi:glycosyltransferase involved in cell wall biosynthesis
MLGDALASVLKQDAAFPFEVITVDNNSTDATRDVIESYASRSNGRLRYLFEGRQGLSYGWNTGITNASATIIALTDDDLLMPENWVSNIKRAFDLHPEVSFVGGRILPVWPSDPPRWLVRKLWAPLALQDDEEEFYTDLSNPICLLAKSFRREVFDLVGMFKPELGRIEDGVGSLEDDEFQRRLWQAGLRGLHVPSIVVDSPVAKERMTKAYFRRWYSGHGRHYAMMRESEFEKSSWRLFDVPSHAYRQAAESGLKWCRAVAALDCAGAFKHEMRLRFFGGFLAQRRREYAKSAGDHPVSFTSELIRLVRSRASREARRTSGGIG